MSRDLSTLRMPEHSYYWDEPERRLQPTCKAVREPGYAHMNPDGTLHCNSCGWVTPEPVVTAYSPDTDCTYLTWEDLVAAEANGWVVVGTVSRPNTVPVVIGPWPADEAGKEEARKAQARLRGRWAREERREHGPGVTVRTFLRPVWKEPRRRG